MKKPIVLPLISRFARCYRDVLSTQAITTIATIIIMTTETGDKADNIIRRTSVRLIAWDQSRRSEPKKRKPSGIENSSVNTML